MLPYRRGVIPRITRYRPTSPLYLLLSTDCTTQSRRLNDAERRSMVHSGAVFIYCSAECGSKCKLASPLDYTINSTTVQRWTEGLTWSPSRIEGNFLVSRMQSQWESERGITVLPVTLGNLFADLVFRSTARSRTR